MERIINLHIEKLPEGVYLATSDELPGLLAQGRTIQDDVQLSRLDLLDPFDLGRFRGSTRPEIVLLPRG